MKITLRKLEVKGCSVGVFIDGELSGVIHPDAFYVNHPDKNGGPAYLHLVRSGKPLEIDLDVALAIIRKDGNHG